MQKILLSLVFVLVITTKSKSQKSFDQPVQLKTCNISIEASPFIATTVMEMGFYNPQDKEVEGFQAFALNKGQVITGFQLELNGQYRDGSIEEKWKANNAYNSIVGKRIDPAILQMDWQYNYTLRIYPIAANNSRRVKIIITQAMEESIDKLLYTLPLNFNKKTASFLLNIHVSGNTLPVCNNGLIDKRNFTNVPENFTLTYTENNIELNKPVSFYIPLNKNQPLLCISKENNKNYFLLRYRPAVERFYSHQVKNTTVYWDVSLSGEERNIEKELAYVDQYIRVHKPLVVTFVLFNQQIKKRIVYTPADENFYTIKNLLRNYKYKGATSFTHLGIDTVKADNILLFSDGFSSFGNTLPKPATVQLNCIVSTNNYNKSYLEKIAGTSGGQIVNLVLNDIDAAIIKTEQAENFLMQCSSFGQTVKVFEQLPLVLDKTISISGNYTGDDTLVFMYGNNSGVNKIEKFYLPGNELCNNETYRKLKMLKSYDSMMATYNWQNMVVFGVDEKVVTPQTAFLVLERVEDYIRYHIAPPKELEQKCAEMNYVYKSSYKIKAVRDFSEQEALQQAVNFYNQRIKWWDKNAELIDLKKPVAPVATEIQVTVAPTISAAATKTTGTVENVIISGFNSNKNLQEVVVTSAMGVTRQARSTSSNAQVIRGEQLNVIRSTNLNNALAGKVAGLQIRGQSSIALGRSGNIRLRGESEFGGGSKVLYVVDGTILPDVNDVNLDDINDITVLQGPNAAALFGPDGANGAIVISTKKARRNYDIPRWSEYAYSSTEDVEYMNIIKKTGASEKFAVYEELENDNKKSPGFYFDMADYFFNLGYATEAMNILYNGVELCRSSTSGLTAAAYILESWKKFNDAIELYKIILKDTENKSMVQRDLALAYYQNGQYQLAVNEYYNILIAQNEYYNYNHIKELALDEMNAVIAAHKKELDISFINTNMVRSLPVDLRVTAESSSGYIYNFRIQEPNGNVSSVNSYDVKKEGRVITATGYYGYGSVNEYAVKKARSGRYHIKIDSYETETNGEGKIPVYLRTIVFKNFQQENQQIQVQNISLDNQYGTVETGSIDW